MATDYQEVLKELRAEEARLESELEIIQATIPGVELLAKRMTTQPVTAEIMFGPPKSLPVETVGFFPYSGMGTKQAIVRYLNSQPFPQMPSVIAQALLDGGIQTKSADFAGMVATTLTQMKAYDGTVERVETGWKIKGQ